MMRLLKSLIVLNYMFKKYSYDFFLIIGIILVSLVSYCLIYFPSLNENNLYLIIYDCNNEKNIIDLSKESKEEREIEIIGLHENVICNVTNSYAYISYSSCPHKDCVNKGKIKNKSEYIVCLYNKVSLVIDGGEGYDIIL